MSVSHFDLDKFGQQLIVVLLFVLLAMVALPAASARAGVDEHGCAESTFCMWINAEYSGSMWHRTINSENQNEWRFVGEEGGVNFNDQASSLDNHRVHSTWVDKEDNPISESNAKCLSSEERISNLTNLIWADRTTVNDSISAFYLETGNRC